MNTKQSTTSTEVQRPDRQTLTQSRTGARSRRSRVDSAQSMLEAPQQIAAACQTAVTALAPGAVAADAQKAIREATAQLDTALGNAAAIPGVSAVRDAFADAMRSLSAPGDTAQSSASREAVVMACALFTGN